MNHQRNKEANTQCVLNTQSASSKCIVTAVLIGVSGLFVPANGQVVNEDSVIYPSANIIHSFGTSLAFEDGVLAVGALNQAASLIDLGTMSELSSMYPVDTDFDALYGRDVEIENGIMAVSASFEDNDDQVSGAVYLYDVATGMQTHRLAPSLGSEVLDFGLSIAMDDGKVVVGYAKGFFVFDAVSGEELNAYELTNFIRFFGNASEVVDGKVFLGVPRDNSEAGFDTGSVYVYDISTGVELMKLVAEDETPSGHFGSSMAVDGGLIVISEPGADNGQGTVYVYELDTFALVSELLPVSDDGFVGPRFGQVVDIENGVVVVGTPNGRSSMSLFGTVQLFDASTGQQTADLIVTDGLQNARRFGSSVLIAGGVVIAGAIDTNTVIVFGDMGEGCVADINGDGTLNFFDIAAFVTGVGDQDPAVDLNGDGDINFFDVSFFLSAFDQGCP